MTEICKMPSLLPYIADKRGELLFYKGAKRTDLGLFSWSRINSLSVPYHIIADWQCFTQLGCSPAATNDAHKLQCWVIKGR
jgi:hypothetical protein